MDQGYTEVQTDAIIRSKLKLEHDDEPANIDFCQLWNERQTDVIEKCVEIIGPVEEWMTMVDYDQLPCEDRETLTRNRFTTV
jgi:hypothetical protein